MPVKPKRVNPLLSKVEVGKPRESVLQLPPSDHIYGVASKRSGASRRRCRFSVSRPFSLRFAEDSFAGDNAKDMLTTWQMHTPNNSEPPGLNFRYPYTSPRHRALRCVANYLQSLKCERMHLNARSGR